MLYFPTRGIRGTVHRGYYTPLSRLCDGWGWDVETRVGRWDVRFRTGVVGGVQCITEELYLVMVAWIACLLLLLVLCMCSGGDFVRNDTGGGRYLLEW